MSMRALLRLSSVLGLALSSLVFLGGPAHACSCVNEQVAKQVDRADQVFTGTVVDFTKSGPGTTGEIVYDVEVDRSFKGDVADAVQVSTAASSATCGLEGIPEGAAYLFFGETVAERESVVTANLCGGSAPLTDLLVKQVEAVTGPGTTTGGSGDGASDTASPGGADRSDRADSASDDNGDDSDDGVPVWPFIGGVLVIALAAGTRAARRTT